MKRYNKVLKLLSITLVLLAILTLNYNVLGYYDNPNDAIVATEEVGKSNILSSLLNIGTKTLSTVISSFNKKTGTSDTDLKEVSKEFDVLPPSSTTALKKTYTEGKKSSSCYKEFKANRTKWESKAKYVYNRLISAGATPAGAAGVLGNINQECRWTTYNKDIKNKYGTFYGMCMWGYGRRTNLKKQKKYNTIECQTDYMIKELKGSYKAVWKVLTTTEDVVAASNIFQEKFEICGAGTLSRQEFSIDWYNYLNGLTKY